MAIDETVDSLLSMPEDEFRQFVEQEVERTRGGHHSPGMRPLLGNERLGNRWREALISCKHQLLLNIDRASSAEDRARLEHVRGLIIEIATVRSLVEFSNDDFQDVVDGEVRRVGGRYLKSLLANPVNIDRWHLSLVQMKKNVESQMGARADDVRMLLLDITNPELADDETGLTPEKVRDLRIERHRAANADFIKWRAGAKRFKLGVEERLLEIRKIHLVNGDFRASEATAANYMLQTLVEGIKAHRAQLLADADPDIGDADTDLWSLLPVDA